jgi:hypothetical protein
VTATEKCRSRKKHDPDELGQLAQEAGPDREDEDEAGDDQPEQGVALGQPPPPDELDDDPEENRGSGDRDDLDARIEDRVRDEGGHAQLPVAGSAPGVVWSGGAGEGLRGGRRRSTPTKIASSTFAM